MAIRRVAEVPCLLGHFPQASTLHILPCSTVYWAQSFKDSEFTGTFDVTPKVLQNIAIQKP